MTEAKFWKRKTQEQQQKTTKLEEQVAQFLLEFERSHENKSEVKDLYLDSVKEFDLTTKKNKKIILVVIPYICHKLFARIQRKFITELEKKLKVSVLMMTKRSIESAWIKKHRSQMRPRNRTLVAVQEAILDDLIAPGNIIGKRTRVRIDGTKFMKVTVDANDKDFLEDKIDAIAQLYKQLTHKDIHFEFKQEQVFYNTKK
jgi:small subunit ribosomal protein S7e